MKNFWKLAGTWFASGAAAATLDVITTGDSFLTNPRHTASLIVAAGLAGVVNHLRQPPSDK